MTPGALLVALEARKVQLAVVDGFLKYRAPPGAYSPELRGWVTVHRHQLLSFWRCWSCGRIARVLYGMSDVNLTCRRCIRPPQTCVLSRPAPTSS